MRSVAGFLSLFVFLDFFSSPVGSLVMDCLG